MKEPHGLFGYETEEDEDGVGPGVNTNRLSDPMDLCVSEVEEYEDGVGVGVEYLFIMNR